MTTTPHRHASEPETEGESFVSLDLDDEVMIYDVDCETAWIQSDTAFEMDSMA